MIATYNHAGIRTLVIGAHYDVAGEQPGADDNASAVAGLLEVARMLFRTKPELDYRIDLVAYCLEEPPYFATKEMGSYVHAKSLKDAGTDVIGMISLEMIGYFSDEPGSQNFPSPELAELYPNTANFIIVVGVEEHAAFAQKV
ncbi:MAG: M28 family peptidase, partial [Bacteroidota bacterium]|nr:M28 family peptidase [Bacteroidota bacterium]